MHPFELVRDEEGLLYTVVLRPFRAHTTRPSALRILLHFLFRTLRSAELLCGNRISRSQVRACGWAGLGRRRSSFERERRALSRSVSPALRAPASSGFPFRASARWHRAYRLSPRGSAPRSSIFGLSCSRRARSFVGWAMHTYHLSRAQRESGGRAGATYAVDFCLSTQAHLRSLACAVVPASCGTFSCYSHPSTDTLSIGTLWSLFVYRDFRVFPATRAQLARGKVHHGGGEKKSRFPETKLRLPCIATAGQEPRPW